MASPVPPEVELSVMRMSGLVSLLGTGIWYKLKCSCSRVTESAAGYVSSLDSTYATLQLPGPHGMET